MCCIPGNLMMKKKPRTNHTTENIIWFSIIIYKSSNFFFNFIVLKYRTKCLSLIIITLTVYCTKSNQRILIFILNIDKAGTNFKQKSMTWRGSNINSKMNIYLCWLKNFSYNILSLRKAVVNPISNCWMMNRKKRRRFMIYCLDKHMKLWLFHTWEEKSLYNNQI